MNLEKLTKKELIDHIQTATVPITKYNKLESRITIYKGDLEVANEKLENEKKVRKSLEDSVKMLQGREAQMRADVEAQANQIIAQRLASVTQLKNDLDYAQNTLLQNFQLLKNIQSYSNQQQQMVNAVIDSYVAGVVTISETNTEEQKE